MASLRKTAIINAANKRKRNPRDDVDIVDENRRMEREDIKPSVAPTPPVASSSSAAASPSSIPAAAAATTTTNVLCLNMTFCKEENVTVEFGKEWQHRQRLLTLQSLANVHAYTCDLRAAKEKGEEGRHMHGNFDRRRWVEYDLKNDFGHNIKFDQVFMDYYDLPKACK